MSDMTALAEIAKASRERVSKLRRGDPVTNICTGPSNPMHHAHFVSYKITGYTNKWGFRHESHWARCKDSNGKLRNIGVEVIHPGHLDEATCQELFHPFWRAKFGEREV